MGLKTLRQVQIPSLIRLKPGALSRVGIYLQREGWSRALVLVSAGLDPALTRPVLELEAAQQVVEVEDASLEWVEAQLDRRAEVVLGLGGGKALDVAKYLAFRLNLPYLALPTSLSNDGFCSPQSSLTVAGKKTSLSARLPVGVVVDLEVAQSAPPWLWLSGVGDLVSKWTAIQDWKLAFHACATPYDDFAALLSDASVFQFLGHPSRDRAGIRLLAQALLLNGVAMEVAGNSRPASGSEHLISHALDQISARPALHGLQVGLATYWMGRLQGQDVSHLEALFEKTGFWSYWREHPMSRQEWLQALEIAPSMKANFHTILSLPDSRLRAQSLLHEDSRLQQSLR